MLVSFITRRCRACHEWKTLDCFAPSRWRCKTCELARVKEWKRANAGARSLQRRVDYGKRRDAFQAKERSRFLKDPIKVQAQRTTNSVRDRCRDLNLPLPEWVNSVNVEKWLRAQPNCACCSVPLHCGPKNGQWREDSPSIDRFDPSLGYERENVSLICWRCNNIKRNYTADDLRRVAAWMDVWGNQTDKFNQEHAAA